MATFASLILTNDAGRSSLHRVCPRYSVTTPRGRQDRLEAVMQKCSMASDGHRAVQQWRNKLIDEATLRIVDRQAATRRLAPRRRRFKTTTLPVCGTATPTSPHHDSGYKQPKEPLRTIDWWRMPPPRSSSTALVGDKTRKPSLCPRPRPLLPSHRYRPYFFPRPFFPVPKDTPFSECIEHSGVSACSCQHGCRGYAFGFICIYSD